MPPIYLVADQILTGLDQDPIPNGVVQVRDGRIVEVASVEAIADRDQVVDLPGTTLMPGMIDCHEHLSGHDRYAIGDASIDEPDMMYALVGTYHRRRLIDIGVTTARVPGAHGHIDLMLRRAAVEFAGGGGVRRPGWRWRSATAGLRRHHRRLRCWLAPGVTRHLVI